ncbi:hypothetical protein SAMN04488055_5454 [Chitinophaga niabensis]|uniref:Uncharacterized protein n=1 Tax=Chitinophaga niabensis TaxID=536979 RepID=A0A1N6KAU3_9BACT|nr:hypothetical protein SAMN04488055_5454 [Chitinophaga niabensis]
MILQMPYSRYFFISAQELRRTITINIFFRFGEKFTLKPPLWVLVYENCYCVHNAVNNNLIFLNIYLLMTKDEYIKTNSNSGGYNNSR